MTDNLNAVSGTDSALWIGGDRGVLVRNGVEHQARNVQRPAGVWALSDDDVWVVGQNIGRWDGDHWQVFSTGRVVQLFGVWAAAADDVWAVGEAGTALRWDGDSWSPVSTGTVEDLYAVWGASPANVWAVGSGGTIVRWNGVEWNSVDSGTTSALASVWGAAAWNVWAVGDDGVMIRWNGSSWQMVPSETDGSLFCVWGSAGDDVWVVGEEGVMRWNGAEWDRFEDPGVRINSVSGVGSRDVLAVGMGGVIMRWNGTSWSYENSGTTRNLFRAYARSPRDMWVLGDGVVLQRREPGG
ncbi:MAG: hypothetical protein KF901_26750 [Myxococcales bacterium]|nr:hypothetical protein [Myxococcales bacterium]